MEVRFIPTSAESIGKKRKQVARACDSCRRSKKRCHHGLNASSQGSPTLETTEKESTVRNKRADLGFVARDEPQAHQSNANSGQTPRPRAVDIRRFIGDLNPESVFLSATSPGSAQRTPSFNDDIGVWLAGRLISSTDRMASATVQAQSGIFYGSESVTYQMFAQVLEQECLSTLPQAGPLDRLCSYYFDHVHPILPIVDRTNFQSLSIGGPNRVLISQGICLISSMNPSCKAYLRLGNADQSLPAREFARRIYSSMRCCIEIGLVTDKIILLQAMGLMTLFTEGPDGTDSSAQFCARSAQTLQTLGLHLAGGHDSKEDDFRTTLFCSIWALDRYNAALHGRPVIMHERDIGIDLLECTSRQTSEFRLLLHVIHWLDWVIGLYRPTNQHPLGYIENFPSFEDLIEQAHISAIPSSSLATIELLYHAVAILSCRSKPIDPENVARFATHPRQSYAALRIPMMMKPEVDGNEQPVMLPFVPYALSLALSITYREMRRAKLSFHRSLARKNLEVTCGTLESLGEYFSKAETFARLGRSTLAELDRVVDSLRDSQRTDVTATREVLPQVRNPEGTDEDRMATQSNSNSQEASEEDTRTNRGGIETYDISRGQNEPHGNTFSFDVFEMFDPGFDLGSVDAYFDSNLDLRTGTLL